MQAVSVVLSILLTLSLFGAADTAVTAVAVTHDVIGDNIWLTAVTFLDKSLLKLGNGRKIWSIGFTFVWPKEAGGNLSPPYFLTPCARPNLPRFIKLKPMVTFLMLALVFLLDLVLDYTCTIFSTRTLPRGLASWSCSSHCSLPRGHMELDMWCEIWQTRVKSLFHTDWVTSHLSVIYITVAPGLPGLMTAGINMILSY